MKSPPPLDGGSIDAWLSRHSGWFRCGEDGVAKDFPFPDFGAALAFAVRVGMMAEGRNHHPELSIVWGSVRVRWTTHDARGITALDLELADATDRVKP